MGMSPSLKPTRLVRLIGPLASPARATIGSQIGFGQQKVPMPGIGIPVAPRGLWPNGTGKKLPTTPMIYDTAEGQTHPRRRRHEGARVSVEHGVSARTATCSSPSAKAVCASFATACSIRSRSPADRSRATSASPASPARSTATWTSRSIRSSPRTTSSTSPTRSRSTTRRQTMAIARGQLGRPRARPRRRTSSSADARHVADRVRQRRQAVRDDGRRRRQRRAGSRTTSAARCCASTTMAACRRTIRSSARPARSRRSTRSAIAARSASPCIPATGEMWLNENGPNGGDEINILKPGRNYGWPIVSYGRTYPGPVAERQGRRTRRLRSRRSCTGCRRSPCRA